MNSTLEIFAALLMVPAITWAALMFYRRFEDERLARSREARNT